MCWVCSQLALIPRDYTQKQMVLPPKQEPGSPPTGTWLAWGMASLGLSFNESFSFEGQSRCFTFRDAEARGNMHALETR